MPEGELAGASEFGESIYATPLLVDIDGYEGPLDVLLALARTQKVDITKISILALAEQYLQFIAEARKLSLEIAADYLVMAAWLAYLKSKLLLPEIDDDGEELSGPEMAARLTWQLKRLEAFRDAGRKLMDRNRLGRDIFRRGQPEGIRLIRNSVYEVSLYELLRAYVIQKEAKGVAEVHLPDRHIYYTIEQALERLSDMLGRTPGWERLESFLPPELRGGIVGKSALASTLVATLEMAKNGKLTMRQGENFGPIYLRPNDRFDEERKQQVEGQILDGNIAQDNREPDDEENE
ncbi:MAG: segregation/condensation protein A [Alphaproteobacteria bacterium]|nr:segregation/condensation protein A [Alphaproteobacteria bacterium]MBT4084664.1 segregation/condensation protein A [Alphaproteobacteria bacterium]MBT4545086.1 segregation/condensation protein A [Alphaproteobacteria bacterium]MBT6386644.1 segregation/condensation protein A [Alphaproteobacteria bacterium]